MLNQVTMQQFKEQLGASLYESYSALMQVNLASMTYGSHNMEWSFWTLDNGAWLMAPVNTVDGAIEMRVAGFKDGEEPRLGQLAAGIALTHEAQRKMLELDLFAGQCWLDKVAENQAKIAELINSKTAMLEKDREIVAFFVA